MVGAKGQKRSRNLSFAGPTCRFGQEDGGADEACTSQESQKGPEVSGVTTGSATCRPHKTSGHTHDSSNEKHRFGTRKYPTVHDVPRFTFGPSLSFLSSTKYWFDLAVLAGLVLLRSPSIGRLALSRPSKQPSTSNAQRLGKRSEAQRLLR
jgi:hypothetical protein